MLAALPLALFAVVVGMYPAASAMINAFVGIAESGDGSQAKLATMSGSMTRTLVVGVSIFLLALIIAGALQAWTAFQQPPPDLNPQSPPDARWKGWALPVSSLAVVPVAYCSTTQLGSRISSDSSPIRPARMKRRSTYAAGLTGVDSVSQLSGRLSAWLVISAIGGVAATPLLLLLGVLNITLVGSRIIGGRATMYPWVVLGVLCLAGSTALVLSESIVSNT